MQSTDLYCDICKTSFQRREHYERHLRTHTKEKPFSCTECGHCFGRVDSLARHYGTVHQRTQHQDRRDRSREKRRIAQACKPCNQSKVRCDGQLPCQRCRKNGTDCYYGQPSKRRLSDHDSPSAKRHQDTLPLPPAPAHLPSWDHPSPQSSDNVILPPLPNYLTPGAALTDHNNFPEQPDYDMSAMDLDGMLDFDLNLGMKLDTNTLPNFLEDTAPLHHFDSFWLSSLAPETPCPTGMEAQVPTPLTSAALTEIYERGRTRPSEVETMEPRQYHPPASGVDAQLTFPDMEQIPLEQVDQENLAHVREISESALDSLAELARAMQSIPNHPPFVELRMPPTRVINAWVQLYFEHFHPVFPVLHKPSFGGPNTHWLLIFVVSAIGAQFSDLPNAQICARAMHELVRRQTSFLCENHNSNGRELWLTQVVLMNQLALRYSGERRALEIAELLQALPITLGRRKQLFNPIMSLEKISQLELPLPQKWQIWALDEERRRTGFAIWLIDSAFQCHFDLTTVMHVREMQITLPQSEDRWGAPTAQAWASFPNPTGAKLPQTLEHIATEHNWAAAWSKVGILGKQAVAQLLLTNILAERHHSPAAMSSLQRIGDYPGHILEQLLLAIDKEEEELPTIELKASIAHRIIILSALMLTHLPKGPLLSAAMKLKYQRSQADGLNELLSTWNAAPHQGRLAVDYAARLFECIRSTYCSHFCVPILLFKSTLVLWVYSVLHSATSSSDGADLAVVLGLEPVSGPGTRTWIESGVGRVKLQGIGNILTEAGQAKLLDEAISSMKPLKAWGVSKIYGQLLMRLRST